MVPSRLAIYRDGADSHLDAVEKKAVHLRTQRVEGLGHFTPQDARFRVGPAFKSQVGEIQGVRMRREGRIVEIISLRRLGVGEMDRENGESRGEKLLHKP
jgi:hypothetical protein